MVGILLISRLGRVSVAGLGRGGGEKGEWKEGGKDICSSYSYSYLYMSSFWCEN